ncbi:glycosyltransferase family 4 protein [Natronogracilivirga saccharolytica]|uniref:Glycosyltransferase family 4 protein n=1 Tax=Natronogracilivirga saccharolytica TaxID=2812953 RepID=A0A8J7UUS7_9BACT|nr:glycosyltransferase family 4 protein [Natronogracilivirga saccharolytica]MBP3193926.1 glycosyltransferase family 4 protein [Natronogracilivirga saccharolytica]
MNKKVTSKETTVERSKGNVLYIIPYPRFFSQHKNVGGHVAHAYGVTSELAEAGYHVRVLMDEKISLMEGPGREITTLPLEKNSIVRRVGWGRRLVRCAREIAASESPEFCYMRYSVGFQNWLPALKKALGNIPLILEVNSFGSQTRGWMAPLEKRFFAYADLVVVISDPVNDAVKKLFGENIAKRTIVVPNGVNPGRFKKWEENLNRKPGKVLKAAYTGLIENWYGLDDVIEGFLKARQIYKGESDLQLHFYGDGPYRQELENRYRDAESIVFHGPKPFEEMPGILGELDILINSDSAQKAYGSPTKMFEYMSTGRPILSARTPQSERLLINGRFGWYYEVGNPDSFAESMLDLIESPEKSKEKALDARRYVENNHTWKQRVESILAGLSQTSADGGIK